MKKYINADALLTTMADRYDRLVKDYGQYDAYAEGYDEAITLIDETEAADVQEVKHGDWKFGHCGYFVCSNCGFAYDTECENYLMAFPDGVKELKYCPYCGARMDG